MEVVVRDGTKVDEKPAREWTLNVSAVAVFIWASIALQLAIPAIHNPASVTLSTDDAMRLTEVRDLLGGQSWFDLTQWRMNAPFGLPMHWSRLVDAPIAGLILLLRQFLNQQLAERVAVSLWPLLSMLAAWLAIGRIAVRLAGKKAGVIAVLLCATGAAVLGYFTPGAIDHHNVQVALTLWAVAFLLDIETRPAAAIGAAIASILSLAIGLEVFPYVATTALVVASLWIIRGAAVAGAVRRFGATFAMAALVILIGVTSRHERFSFVCDAYSGFYATFAIVGGLGLTSLTFLGTKALSMLQRTLFVAALGLVLLLLTVAIAPSCLAGPYGNVSPRIAEIFLSRVEEVQSPVLNAARDWSFFFYGYIYSAVGLAACAFTTVLVAQDKRAAAIIVTAFAAMSFAVMSVEVRGVLFALLVSLPGLAASIQLLVERWTRPGWRAALATVAALLVFSDVTFAYAAFEAHNLIESPAQQAARTKANAHSWYCYGQLSVAQLANLPKGRVVAFLDQGPAILAYSRDSVIAGPYHRNEQGILDTFDLLTKRPNISAQIARRRGVDYVVICRTSYDYSYYLNASGPDGLFGRLVANRTPAWLSPITTGMPSKNVTIYRVLRDQLSP